MSTARRFWRAPLGEWRAHATKPVVITVAALVVFVALWGAFALRVPYNMDEAIHYQPVACRLFPFAELHVFRDTCGEKDLHFLTWLPLRAYTYVGALSNVAFLPFWALLDHPISLRLFSLVLALGTLGVIARLARVPLWKATLALGLFPPFLFQHVVDTGPIAWQLFWGCAGSLAFARGLEGILNPRPGTAEHAKVLLRSLAWAGLAGVSFFLVLEQKLFGIFFFPFFGCVLLFRWRGVLGRLLPLARTLAGIQWMNAVTCVLATAGIAASLLTFLLSLKTRAGETYGSVLRSNSSRLTWEEGMLHLEKAFHFLTSYVSQPEQYLHRVYAVPAGDWYRPVAPLAAQWDALPWPSFSFWPLVALCALPFVCLVLKRSSFLWCLSFLSLGVAVFFAVVNVRYSWAGHHIIAAHLLAALAALAALAELRGWRAGLLAGALVAVSVLSYARAARLEDNRVLDHSSRSREEVFEYVDDPAFARAYMVVHTHWGTYYLDALFGPRDQFVTFLELARDSARFEEALLLARSQGRKIAFLGRSNNSTAWRDFVAQKGLKTLKVSKDSLWTVWGEETPSR